MAYPYYICKSENFWHMEKLTWPDQRVLVRLEDGSRNQVFRLPRQS